MTMLEMISWSCAWPLTKFRPTCRIFLCRLILSGKGLAAPQKSEALFRTSTTKSSEEQERARRVRHRRRGRRQVSVRASRVWAGVATRYAMEKVSVEAQQGI